ncbi:DUF4178 domain-containing protein [Kingella negevensis]|uniref:DUF4178 domain-containing protein n=1 Tax=Kingella negevensis TaxID=1522312 RepID=UPI002550B154|nr:DUF4178 domain-containing protein [Kingella negevensis]MDK4680682.1 DUF4178 domain-containing protein [Kingella negevensis]MDK4681594.1 DUF4178 domain-containing protein [Kingella negevensis]MDK4689793.1 DUF4178 domain-containing protein [Kingella negevensis]MDK4692864.1 DUF4178 domain-containing protein [Kingella negevensis]MDK4699164.1 DUF4178 domain-containing protein [Kingella negevensis]
MTEPLFHTTCPSCGAPVQVHSATAVTIICSYCSSLLTRQDNSLQDTGRDSALLQDFSPLQIGTTGTYAAQSFNIIGRLQAKYDSGIWNEWYIKFNDGTDGWLSESSDQYVIVKHTQSPNNPPEFHTIRAGVTTLDFGKRFIASDVHEITLSQATAQGELPFRLPENYQNRVSDWRSENAFLTLDYEQTPPLAYLGRTVKLNELSLGNTRDETQIRQSAGSLKGTHQSENCPNCGSPVNWITGATANIICPSCSSEIDTSNGKAELIAANNMRQAQDTASTLPLGKTGNINGTHYTVIGLVRKEEISFSDAYALMNQQNPAGYGVVPQGYWTEYLLYSPSHGFKWLVETPEDGFSLSETLADFPRLDAHNRPQGSTKLYDYGSRVSYAAGAFYWHIRANDINVYQDYRQGNSKLSAEYSRNELAWSKSTPVPYQQIAQWFNLGNAPKYTTQMKPDPVSRGLVYLMMAVFVIINIPAWLMMGTDGDGFEFSFFVSAVVLFILHGVGTSSDD